MHATGQAFITVTLRDAGEARLSLVDDGDEAIAEVVVKDPPWEESAAIPGEATAHFRRVLAELEGVSGGEPVEGAKLSLRIEGATTAAVDARDPEALPGAYRRLLTALRTAAGAALEGARSRKVLETLGAWSG